MNNIEENKKESRFLENTKEVLNVLKDPSNKEALRLVRTFVRVFLPNPLIKLLYDIIIIVVLVFLVIYCADHKYIDPENVQSLLTLIVGAIIGARFKG